MTRVGSLALSLTIIEYVEKVLLESILESSVSDKQYRRHLARECHAPGTKLLGFIKVTAWDLNCIPSVSHLQTTYLRTEDFQKVVFNRHQRTFNKG